MPFTTNAYITGLYGYDGFEECAGCHTEQPADEIKGGYCLLCWAKRPVTEEPTPAPLTAPLEQSEYERIMDEIKEATRTCNEWADRIEELLEQARQSQRGTGLNRTRELFCPGCGGPFDGRSDVCVVCQ